MKKCRNCKKKNRSKRECTLCRLEENRKNQINWNDDAFGDNYRKIGKLLVKKEAMKKSKEKPKFTFEKQKPGRPPKREDYPCRGFKIYEIPDKWCFDCPTKYCRFEYADEIGIGW